MKPANVSDSDAPASVFALARRWPQRIAIERLSPTVDGGAWPSKHIVGQPLNVEADVFSDGHDVVECDVLWRKIDDREWLREPMAMVANDRWRTEIKPDRIGSYEFFVEAWINPYASWANDVTKKVNAGLDLKLEVQEGLAILNAVDHRVHDLPLNGFNTKAGVLDDKSKLSLLMAPSLVQTMRDTGPRLSISRTRAHHFTVDRKRAAFSSWYELFPRSAANDTSRHGTFDDVIARLPYVRDLGFDVLYLPPIHPIGEINRKGRNNGLVAQKCDPGSVYAIGSKAGGHDAIHPELGNLADFARLVHAAQMHDLEIALDIAWQCAPDHPWLSQHPNWFEHRPDGSIKFAENPPKKYEDIVNIRFDGEAYEDVWSALRDVVLFWASQGVRIFRIDNPHTKPLPFWEWMIEEVVRKHPDCIFLAEAFTRPKMMKRLAKVGFQQSYTYFTWRNAKSEITDYVNELNGEMARYYRPNFFVNTPDINPFYLQKSGRAGFIVRATLAATLSGNWGIYSGFELCESAALPGREEYVDSEKYELKARDFDAPGNIKDQIRRLNAIRNAHGALQTSGNITFLNAFDDDVIAYVRISARRDEGIMVVANLDPYKRHECAYEAPLWEFGLPDDGAIEVEDLLFGGRFTLYGKNHRIALDPAHNPVIIWRLIAPSASQG